MTKERTRFLRVEKMAELIFVFILMTKIQIALGLTYMTLLQI